MPDDARRNAPCLDSRTSRAADMAALVRRLPYGRLEDVR